MPQKLSTVFQVISNPEAFSSLPSVAVRNCQNERRLKFQTYRPHVQSLC